MAGERTIEHLLNIRGSMKFKPIALLVIGLFLGSTITLSVTRSSAPPNEILACTNMKSGKVRLTITGECNIQTESESAVTNLWGLQPTTVPPVQSTSTTTTLRRKYVVDAKGKNLGLLTSSEGRTALWVLSPSGQWRLSIETTEVIGLLRPANTLEGPIFSDEECSLPLLRVMGEGTDLKSERAVAEVMIVKGGKSSVTRQAFQPTGRAIGLPPVFFGFGYEENQLTCVREQESSITDGKPTFVVKSKLATAPSYSPPLRIVDR
jgi:hypothetical protein